MTTTALSAAEKARQIAAKYSGDGLSFKVKYLGTQEVSSAKGDAVIADCLKQLRTLFKDVSVHLPKVVITLQLTGVTVIDEKSKLETIKVPLNQVSYVCLDPADSSVFSFIIRSNDTISSKGLRLHAFVCHPQVAMTFNRSARELFDFLARLMKAKKKMAAQQQEADTTTELPSIPLLEPQTIAPASTTTSSSSQPPEKLLPAGGNPFEGSTDEEKRQQAVFDEWKDLEKELDDIGQELGISSPSEVPVTSTPTASPAAAATTSTNLAPKTSQLTVSSAPQPPDIMTASGSDPFSSTFFDNSFSTALQPPAAPSIPQSNGDSNIFDNPVFNGHPEKIETISSSEGAAALSPEGKRLTYASRPRPKGKSLDAMSPLSPPPPISDGKDARELSLSPDSEEKVKNILTNTDPFSPHSVNTFQFPQPSGNESGFFQPPSFTPMGTPNSGVFSPTSVMTQDSIQLVNPLYQSSPYTPNGSFSGPFSSPPAQVPYQMGPGVMSPPMQPGFQGPPQLVMMQQVPALQQPQVPPIVMSPQAMLLAMGTNSFDGILSPTVISSPTQPPPGGVGGSGWPPQSAQETALQREQRDRMFADLLSQTLHPIPEKRKKFEPEKKEVAKPTLSELQEKKMKEQEQAFKASISATSTEEKGEDVIDWPLSPFDDVVSTQPPEEMPEPLFASSPVATATATGNQQTPGESAGEQQKEQLTQVLLDLDSFDAAPLQQGGTQNQSIESAFEAPQSQALPPSPPATNDPFAPTATHAASPTEKAPNPWNTF